MFTDTMTLQEARDALRDLVDHGHECPCCRQFAKVYRRKLTASMAYMLIKMYRHGAHQHFVHLPSLRDGDGAMDTTMAQYWNLIVEDRVVRPDGGRVGWWMLTDHGTAFVRREDSIPKYARIYNGRRLGLTGPDVTMDDALGTKFNYAELMAGV